MATIIEFPRSASTSRRKSVGKRRTGNGCEVLFFTGVRYSRSEGGPVRVKRGIGGSDERLAKPGPRN